MPLCPQPRGGQGACTEARAAVLHPEPLLLVRGTASPRMAASAALL
eukprot:CAMPEP_0171071090 /NCGR_PEP_ID=MMETSP0766_2-20121228/10125_1 /TAXON_ID=439317 /ORGANISM="Gambierdiscus australes, Strain CAWD 149" /LENGTH=45 /DNA_ID= /DNA_START= /DNA_END= /DNA_ORIENTATION=